MKHWLWYRVDGSLGGEVLCPAGFDDSLDLNDDSDDAPQIVKDYRLALSRFDDFVGCVPHVCGCDPSQIYCDCARSQHINCYNSNGVLVPKPTYELVLDDVVIPFVIGYGSPNTGKFTPNTVMTVDRTPGSSSFLKLRTKGDSPESIPDGMVFYIENSQGPEVLASNPTELVFSGGETSTVELIAPVQGFITTISARPEVDRRGHPQSLRLRGWA